MSYRHAAPGGPAPAAPLSLEVRPVRRSLPPRERTTTHVLVRLRALEPGEARPRPALSVVLALDASGSMAGEPIEQVIRSAGRLAELLAPGDRLGVVAFSQAASVVAPARPLDPAWVRELGRRVEAIRADGGTNVEAGLAEAGLLLDERRQGERQLVLLLSDGKPNVGAATPEALSAAARRLRDRGVAVSTLGYGSAHDDAMLGAIAEAGGGRYAFVADPKLAESAFVRALGAQLDVAAEEVRLLLSPASGVEIARVLDDPESSFGSSGLRVRLPDLVAGDELNVVVELRAEAPSETGPFELLRARVSARPAGRADAVERELGATLDVSRMGGGEVDAEAAVAVAIARAAELRQRARASGDRRSFAEAEARLLEAQRILEEAPGFVLGGEGPLFDAHEALTDDLTVVRQAPSGEAYARYSKAARDYGEFAYSGSKVRGGGKLAASTPSTRALLDRALGGAVRPGAHLEVLSGPGAGSRVPLDAGRVVIGRASGSADLVIHDASVSRQHAIVEFSGGGFYLVDLGSTGGVYLGEHRVTRTVLSEGDTFRVGQSEVRFRDATRPA